jgi:orotidine-5'-phosphate decarboxylase
LAAVTTLTSLDQEDLRVLGVTRPLPAHSRALAELAVEAGIDGVVTSPLEAAVLRRRLGPDPALITPGIRLPEGEAGDQKRIATPEAAVGSGATHLVVGRPILEAPDPHQAALDFLARIDAAAGA